MQGGGQGRKAGLMFNVEREESVVSIFIKTMIIIVATILNIVAPIILIVLTKKISNIVDEGIG